MGNITFADLRKRIAEDELIKREIKKNENYEKEIRSKSDEELKEIVANNGE